MPVSLKHLLTVLRYRHLARWLPAGTRRGDAARALKQALVLLARGGPRAALAHLRRALRERDNPTRWLADQTPSAPELEAQRRWTPSRRPPPQFSLLVPLYRTQLAWLDELVESVRAQTYRGWELCLAVALDEPEPLRRRVTQLCALDARIRAVSLPHNRGISATTNAALDHALGDYLAFVDHDDRLAPHALYEMARLLDEHPETDLVYSDEAYLSADGRRAYRPVLKPGWSPERLLASNYVGHLAVYRRSLVLSLGGLRSECDGAQDWDLALRVSERTSRIRHLPRVLYYWRAVAGSCALEPLAKPWALTAQRRALAQHLHRRGLAAQIETRPSGLQRLVWSAARQPRVSIVVPTRDQPRLISRLIQGLTERTRYSQLEIILVDTQSRDPRTLALYDAWQKSGTAQILSCPGPFNYSRACNQGARAAQGELLLFLNNDIEVIDEHWLEELVAWASRPELGVVGGQLLYPDGRIQHAGVALGGATLGWHLYRFLRPEAGSTFDTPAAYRNVLALTGACQMIRRELFQRLGGYDESFELCYSDFALALAAHRAGYRNLYTPDARLVHHECATRVPLDVREQRDAVRFAALLAAIGLWEDPFFHSALTADAVPRLRGPGQPSAAEQARQAAAELLRSGLGGLVPAEPVHRAA